MLLVVFAAGPVLSVRCAALRLCLRTTFAENRVRFFRIMR
jgi:hypothetical protein